MTKQLSADQLVAIEWLSLPRRGGKTYEEIAAICGVHPNTIANWRKNETFQRELKREMVRKNTERLPELIESLTDIAITDRNAAMAKLALQVSGMLTDKVEVETRESEGTDVEALKQRLMALKAAGHSSGDDTE
ncbi:helix-turn-helix domain-containing protein [Paenibacillus sp. PAMC21692]|uniref:helix-turn-helix domain-containing protein n=1 Tax=Paenibacillus sp. PAMC21692 TaxID=2762320 RepID=UPI00164E9D98|nr:phBC6A51 family helix-turn-helix protein [Paenibacillus sp. PAMC21692]QNK54554.1 helix-turn-helix domain-containing protein [Paenibacillus sp. PAMC21692]